MLRSFKIALGFLTIFRNNLPPYSDFAEVAHSAWTFPIVGALIGVILAIEALVLHTFFPPALSAVIIVGTWVIITGGLHLDGWADCWDALAAPVSVEKRFEILKDSRLGTFGALGLILLLAVKTAALLGPEVSFFKLLLAPVVGRTMMVIATHRANHRGEGMASLFLTNLHDYTVKWTAIVGFVPVLLTGLSGVLAAVVAYLSAVWFRRLAESRLQAVNGDVIGSICEMAEAVFLVMVCVRIW